MVACAVAWDFGVGGHGNRIVADRQFAIEPDIDHVEHGDGIAAGIGYVDVLAIVGRVLGKVVRAATGEAEREQREGQPG